MINSIKLVTFDITGTLLRVKFSVGDQYAEALKRAVNISCDPNNITKSFRQTFALHDKAYPIFGKKAGLTTKAWWKSVFLNTLIASNTINPSQYNMRKDLNDTSVGVWQIEQASPINKAFDNLYNNFEYDTFPHAHQLLNYLKQNSDVVLGVITNSDERIETALKMAGLLDYFDFAITSTKCGYEKPDKRIFDHALNVASKKLSLESPVSSLAALHIGDSLEKDYQGAINAGFKTAFLLDPSNQFSSMINPDHLVKDLAAVLSRLEKIL